MELPAQALALLHKARLLVQRQLTPDCQPDDSELMGFLAHSESLLRDGLGVSPQYFQRPPDGLPIVTKRSSGGRWHAWQGTNDGSIARYAVGGFLTEQEAIDAVKEKEAANG